MTGRVASAGEHASPLRFRGNDHRCPKTYWETTQRAATPEATLSRIQPLLRPAGITRCADITGLDRLGIPVTVAVRPNSRLLVGSTGKGTSLVHAQVSGLMEALEIHHAEYAEDADLKLVRASYAELAAGGADLVPPALLPVARDAAFDVDWELSWAWGFDLVRQAETPVPFLFLHLARQFLPAVDANEHRAKFMTGSNGLASGNNLLEAIAAALYEVIERDAITVWTAAEPRGRRPPSVDLDRVDSPAVAELVERCRRAAFGLHVFDWTTDIGVPTYTALLIETPGHGFDISTGGYGTHLDPDIAMIRAITEAAQSRAVGIAGSRDDFFTAERTRPRPRRMPPPGPPAPERASAATDSFEGDLRVILDRLAACGLHRVVVTDLKRPDFDLDVVKVWVPGLEEYVGSPWYRSGERAQDPLRHTDPERTVP